MSGRSGYWKTGALSDRSGPRTDEVEVSLLEPGYGESILVHTSKGEWLVVDSCRGADGEPAALSYLRGMDLNPSMAVKMVVAMHWHDDYVHGMAQIVSAGRSAHFRCASALKTDEFLGLVGGRTKRDHSAFGSGVRDLRSGVPRLVPSSGTG